MSKQRESFGSVSFHAGADAVVRLSVYPDETPILSLDAGRLTVSIMVAGRTECPAEAVAFARQLADKAIAFAAECERLHAAHAHAIAEATGGDMSTGAAQSAA